MQSMIKFITEKKSLIGIRSSVENFGIFDKIAVIPLYALSQIERIVEDSISQ